MTGSMLDRNTVPPGVDATQWRQVDASETQASREEHRAPQPRPWPGDVEDGFEPSVIRGMD